jgi:hypothetical protein
MSFLSRRASAVWFLLVAATVSSWWFGTHDHVLGNRDPLVITSVILGIAYIKVRLVVLDFMEVRHAPILYRAAAEIAAIVVCAAILGLYALGPTGLV